MSHFYASITIQKGDYNDFCLVDDLALQMNRDPRGNLFIEVNVSQVPADELDGFYGVLNDAEHDWDEIDPNCTIRIWSAA
jgi:hypothetical protein